VRGYTIFKYQVEPGAFHLSMPAEAKPLTVRWQKTDPNGYGRAQMWFILPVDQPPVTRSFVTFPTGATIYAPQSDQALDYVGTFETPEGLIFHVFECVMLKMGETH
jgi:hypothetical protein